MPLWKYGGRAVMPRRIGPLNCPMCANRPDTTARPGSVVIAITPSDLRRRTNTGRPATWSRPSFSGDGSDTPMLIGRRVEWSPTFGASWQLLHDPRNAPAGPGAVDPSGSVIAAPFNPPT